MNELLDAGNYKQLFLDDHAMESKWGVVRRLHQPDRQGPVLKADRSRQQTLVQSTSEPQWNPDKGLWEWWYTAHYNQPGASWESSQPHYATSTDGVAWETPSLGLYEWRGSRDNNLAYHSQLDFLRRQGLRNPPDIGERRLCHIIRDEQEPDPDRRYKGIFSDKKNSGRYPGVSPDGFHWTFPHVPPVPSDDTSSHIYDEIGDQYVLTVKQRTEWGRSVWLSTSQDFVDFTEPRLVLHTDEIDQRNRRQRIRQVVDDPAYLSPPTVDDETDYIAQLYVMSMMPYEGLYVGFPLLFNPAGPDLSQVNHCGINQTELAVSRDLYNWERVADREVFLGVQPWDGVNYGTCQVAVCGQPIVRDDEIWVYHNAVRFRGVPESYAPEYREYFDDMGALEVARLRLDGFVSMDADREGSIVTRPMEAQGRQLYVNAEAGGGVRAAVLDAETMEPLPGFTASECEPLTGDQLAGRLTWPQGPIDADRPVRMRFELANAKLYAFWLAD